jgi:hypothetical protein
MILRFLNYLFNKLVGGSTSPSKKRLAVLLIIPAKEIKHNPNIFIMLDFLKIFILSTPSLYRLIVMIVVKQWLCHSSSRLNYLNRKATYMSKTVKKRWLVFLNTAFFFCFLLVVLEWGMGIL